MHHPTDRITHTTAFVTPADETKSRYILCYVVEVISIYENLSRFINILLEGRIVRTQATMYQEKKEEKKYKLYIYIYI